MYSYTFDPETGGILLNSTPTNFSKEPRPVFAMEMNLLGFNLYWRYEDQNDVPYMWAESNVYWYRGVKIAQTKGGDLYHSPELIPCLDENNVPFFADRELSPVDIPRMNERNAELLAVVEESTVKRIVRAYEKYRDKLDIFHVAFSGGKDSEVMLDLVKKALPKDSFVVIFGDTGMEFPDTYALIEREQKRCEEEGIPFFAARSHFKPEESWKLFGPPARVLRWCCSVHKSAPQTLKMREITGKNDYVGMDFVGVRKHESLTRSSYEFENFGKKQKGQYSFNPILEWTSAEIWLYILGHNLEINDAYKKGNVRVGCLFCPMEGGRGDFFQFSCYPNEVGRFIDLIKSINAKYSGNEKELASYISNGGWNARKNGRDLKISHVRYSESFVEGKYRITISNPSSEWKEWIKTIKNLSFDYEIVQGDGNTVVQFDLNTAKDKPLELKTFKQVFKKAAYCVGCRVCETNCSNGKIKFYNGKVLIEDCLKCGQCHEIIDGCLVYHSLRLSTGVGKMSKASLNSFANHAPKPEWVQSFFSMGNNFWESDANSLNLEHQVPMLKKFLRSCGLIDDKGFTTHLYDIVSTNEYGLNSKTTWGLLLSNLTYNAQCMWYVSNLDIGVCYERSYVSNLLETEGVKKNDASSIINAFKRFCELPLGTVFKFGYVEEKGRVISTLCRTKCALKDSRVLLYALYKFVEKCNLSERDFHLSYLYDETTERDGVSPVRLFGLYDEEELKSMLLGLSAAYPDFIHASFTNDLKAFSLREKTSEDVLQLF